MPTLLKREQIHNLISILALRLHNASPVLCSQLQRRGQSSPPNCDTDSSICDTCCLYLVVRRMPKPTRDCKSKANVRTFSMILKYVT